MITLYIYRLRECDTKKCTAIKILRKKLAKKITTLPTKGIILYPTSEKVLSREDLHEIQSYGLIAIDCSWKNIEKNNIRHRNVRALPYLLASNPVNYSKPCMLSTLEAFAGALYILDAIEMCYKLLSLYNWGKNFITLNKELLESYRSAKTSEEIIKLQNEFCGL